MSAGQYGASTGTLSRPLGTSERVYWLYDRAVCTNFVVFAELDVPPEISRLKSALTFMHKRHPSLRARIEVENDSGRVSFRQGPGKPIPVEEKISSGNEWREEVVRQLDLPFEPGTSPLARCMLFHAAQGSPSIFAVTFSHAVADARSAAVMVEEMLSSAYEGEEADDAARPPCPPQERLYPVRFRGVRGFLTTLRIIIIGILDLVRGRYPARIRFKSHREGTKRILRLFSFQLDREESAGLHERCKREKTTVGAALGAAQLLASFNEVQTGGKAWLGLAHAIDMRKHLEMPLSDRDLGMYSSTVPTIVRIDPETDFWETARKVKGQLNLKLSRGDAHVFWSGFPPDAFFPPDAKGAARLKNLFRKVPPMTVLTNIGNLTGASRGGVQSIQFAIGPPPGCPLVTSASSLNGVLFVNCCYDLSLVEEELATRMTAGIRENLIRSFAF